MVLLMTTRESYGGFEKYLDYRFADLPWFNVQILANRQNSVSIDGWRGVQRNSPRHHHRGYANGIQGRDMIGR